MTARGALLFGRFAFPPNQLGYCGPPDHQALLEYVSAGHPDQGMVELEKRFDGAFPYLKLIAHANEIPDPFDERVVEAYWLGNQLLRRAEGTVLYDSLQERFAKRMPRAEFQWLVPKLEAGAHPHHNFHVFDINIRAGHHRGVRSTVTVEALDACRISWGTVEQVDQDHLLIARQPLLHGPEGLHLGPSRTERVVSRSEGRSLAPEFRVGDTIAVHWNWACMKLDQRRAAALCAATSHCLRWANQTM